MYTKSQAKALKPDLKLETAIDGNVCGLDEVGRGPLAGPVVAACVYIPEHAYTLPFISEIRDSKKLSKAKLIGLYSQITSHFDWSVCSITPEEIDEINILQASLKAMRESLHDIGEDIHHALVDGNRLPVDMPCSATPIIKGDSKSVSIAAASIVAKVTRDTEMERLHAEHPHYGWEKNVGYPTKQHLEAIDTYGTTAHHRKSFGPVRNYLTYGCVKPDLKTAG